MHKTALVVAALTAFAAPAQALTVFSDNFDTENGGHTALNYSGFANFTTVGSVDIVKSGAYGITCSGSCVDLVGSPGAGALVSDFFNYSAGDKITLSFDLGGSQRLAATSLSKFVFEMTSTTDGFFADAFSLLSNDPFATYSYSFTASAAGLLQFAFSSPGKGTVGPLLDNVVLDITSAIPEPTTWAMMIGGLALVGVSLRRRKTTVSFV
jgi:hypothetical protein